MKIRLMCQWTLMKCLSFSSFNENFFSLKADTQDWFSLEWNKKHLFQWQEVCYKANWQKGPCKLSVGQYTFLCEGFQAWRSQPALVLWHKNIILCLFVSVEYSVIKKKFKFWNVVHLFSLSSFLLTLSWLIERNLMFCDELKSCSVACWIPCTPTSSFLFWFFAWITVAPSIRLCGTKHEVFCIETQKIVLLLQN